MKRFLTLFIVLLLVIGSVHAQDNELTESYVFENALLELFYPDNWDIVEEDDFISLETDDTSYLPSWYFPDGYEELDIEQGDVESVLRASTSHLEDHDFDEDAIETEEVDGVELTLYSYESEDDNGNTYQVVKIVNELPNEVGYFIGTVFPISDEEIDEDDYEDALLITANVKDIAEEGDDNNGGPGGAGDDDDDDSDSAFDETYSFDDVDLVVSYDGDWDLTENENGTITFETGDSYIDIVVFDEDTLDDENIEEGDLLGVIEVFYDRFNIDFDEDDVEMTEVGNVEIATAEYFYETDDSEYNGQVIVRELPDGTIVLVDVYPSRGDEPIEEDVDAAFEVSAELEND